MKIAIYGTWHVHAPAYTEEAMKYGEVIGVYEENKEWREAFCKQYQLKEFTTPEELLESDAEGVVVCCATDAHAEAILRIANAGKHIFTEKVLALTDEDCAAIEKAVEDNGVKFVISMPWKYNAGPRTMKKLVDSGELGKINYLRFRNCHSGSIDNWLPTHFYNAKECGGGAMIDLGAHGMYLTEWFLGMPDTFTSVFGNACENPDTLAKNPDGVEDNAVTVMGYKNGCIAVNETGFVSKDYPLSLEIGGACGYARMEGGSVLKATAQTQDEAVAVTMEAELASPIVQFVTGKSEEGCGMREAKALTHMMVKAYADVKRSAV